MKTYAESDLLAELRGRAALKRGLTIMGSEYGLSLAFLSQVMSGKRHISDKLADAMGYTKETIFKPKQEVKR